jgi:mRNA interferase MazF
VVARGEVWWYEPPEVARRPFVILTRTEAIPVLNQVLAAPVTTTVRRIPTEVVVDESDGMPRPGVVSLDNVTPIRTSLCVERITVLGLDRMRSICDALRIAVAC